MLLLVTHLAGVDAIAAESATAIAATAAAAAEKKTATAATTLPLNSGQAQSAGDVMDSLTDPAAAAALAEQKPADSLPANANATATAAASAAASEVKQPPGLTEARGPSVQESRPELVSSAATGPERRAAAPPVQPALSSTAPALAGPAPRPPAMQAEPMTTAPPVSALGGVTGAPEMQADLSVAGPPALQPAAFNNVLAATAPAADKLTPQVGTSGWDQAVGQKLVWMAAGAQSSASLTLNPPDLGPLQVALTIVNNQANVSFTAAQPEVRQALEAALPKLREMLGDAGIQMGQASVNAGAPQQHGGHGESRQTSRGVDEAAGAPLSVADSQAAGGRQGLIDTFA
ncbi:flagellar hook-length control protein FliK [Polaromonas sp. AET17H-212]|uniref:flagellar hook-length control protein FliK n=1 Tax=Polaromonas sp. AET17H-212 TaxID=1977061 RepID=UPI0020D110DB|nr:flagellar hook-length control protein FliK [Polaromonas sp. AET17H-212]